jgi:hypothetical protein
VKYHFLCLYLKNVTVIYNTNYFCRFKEEVSVPGGVKGFRFTPPEDVFSSVEKNPENDCFCPSGPPCAPHGLMNVSLCQYGKK